MALSDLLKGNSMGNEVNTPMVQETHLEDFFSILVGLAGGSDNPIRDGQALLRMLAPKYQDMILGAYDSAELREIMSHPWPRFVGDVEPSR